MTTWSVPATVERIIDGDTIVLILDLGWHITLTVPCRVWGINCPEMNTTEGRAARARAVELLPLGSRVMFVSRKLDKYGRPLGHVLLPDGTSFGDRLVAEGYAVVMAE